LTDRNLRSRWLRQTSKPDLASSFPWVAMCPSCSFAAGGPGTVTEGSFTLAGITTRVAGHQAARPRLGLVTAPDQVILVLAPIGARIKVRILFGQPLIERLPGPLLCRASRPPRSTPVKDQSAEERSATKPGGQELSAARAQRGM
jgi:hypothetical protein